MMESSDYTVGKGYSVASCEENSLLDSNVVEESRDVVHSEISSDYKPSDSQDSQAADSSNDSCHDDFQAECSDSNSHSVNVRKCSEELSDLGANIPNVSDDSSLLGENSVIDVESSQENDQSSADLSTRESPKNCEKDTSSSDGISEKDTSHSSVQDCSDALPLPNNSVVNKQDFGNLNFKVDKTSVDHHSTSSHFTTGASNDLDNLCDSTKDNKNICIKNGTLFSETKASDITEKLTLSSSLNVQTGTSSTPLVPFSVDELVQDLSSKSSEQRRPSCENTEHSSLESESSSSVSHGTEDTSSGLLNSEFMNKNFEVSHNIRTHTELKTSLTGIEDTSPSEQPKIIADDETGSKVISESSTSMMNTKQESVNSETGTTALTFQSLEGETAIEVPEPHENSEHSKKKQNSLCETIDFSKEKSDDSCSQSETTKNEESVISSIPVVQQVKELLSPSKALDLSDPGLNLKDKLTQVDEIKCTSTSSNKIVQDVIEPSSIHEASSISPSNQDNPQEKNDPLDKKSTIEAIDLTQTHDGENCISAIPPCSDVPEEARATEEKSSSSDVVSEHVKLDKKETGFPDEFEGLVTIGRYISVKGDFTLRSSEALIESPSLVAPFLLKEPDIFPVCEQPMKTEDRGFFRSSVGEFLVGLGLSRVNEWYHRDMARIKTKQMQREGRLSHLEQEYRNHQSTYLQAKMANEPYSFRRKTCTRCGFGSESDIVLEGHMLTPHVTSRREYQCSFCSYIHRDPKEILRHMKTEHNKTGRIEPPLPLHECPYCIYVSNSRPKLTAHISKCMRYFDHGTNQAPPGDFDFPCLTPKPITVAMVKTYEKSRNSMQNQYKRPKKVDNVFNSFHHFNQISDNSHMQLPYDSGSVMNYADGLTQVTSSAGMSRKTSRPVRPAVPGSVGANFPHYQYPQSNRFFPLVNSGSGMLPVFSNDPAVSSPLQFSFLSNIASQKNAPSQSFKNTYPGLPQPPKLQGPYPVHMDKSMPSLSSPLQPNSLVVCEICDGYIKDMEQLRTHMQLIHKVKIHPKVLSSRPPLNCQKCQWRFFTDQGLERHLLGSHGLVTSNMQEMANKSSDAGCCTICGRVFASKLVAHMNQVHKITLKPAHLSYKCTVCSATFNLYRLFENHVYLVHSGASKRPADSNDLPPSKKIAKVSNWDQIPIFNRDKHQRSVAEKENGTA